MQMSTRVLIHAVWILAANPALVWCGLGPASINIFALQQQADAIVVARVQDRSLGTPAVPSVGLQMVQTIKGRVPSDITASLAPSPVMSVHAASPNDLAAPAGWRGRIGLWFLRESNGNYQVLPLATGNYTWTDAFLPLPAEGIPDPLTLIPGLAQSNAPPVERLLLSALVSWYQSLPDPTFIDDDRLLSSLYGANPGDALAVANSLRGSLRESHRVVGLQAAVSLGSDDALSALAAEAAALRWHRKFPAIADALRSMYRPDGEKSILALHRLVASHSDLPGLDAAAGVALKKIGTKAVLPAMVELLDSRDPEAQLRAIAFLADFAMFSDAAGNLPGPGVEGPFAAATAAYNPSRGATLTAEEYVKVWKAWWADNKATLGFTGQ
jgi:hypothetical protein